MKTNLILFLLIITSPAFSQKTKKVTIKSDYSSKEVYYVLKSDETIKHGEYKKEFNGKILKQGIYENNERTGIWEYYNLKDELTHKVNFLNNKILFDKFSTENSKFNSEKYSRPLILLGGFDALFQQINYSLRYPSEARRKGTQGKVYVKLIFNSKGLLENTEIIEGVGDGLDEEALRVIQLIDVEALPALDNNGEPTSSEIIFPINFLLG